MHFPTGAFHEAVYHMRAEVAGFVSEAVRILSYLPSIAVVDRVHVLSFRLTVLFVWSVQV